MYAFLVGGMAAAITWEACYSDQAHLFGEQSLLESLQVTLLFLTALCVYSAGYLNGRRGALETLLAGFASIALIRELDAALDHAFFDGAWQLLASLTAIAIIFALVRHRKELHSSISSFARQPSFGIMYAGFMTVFVFSRMMGRKVLWQTIMGDGYMRIVKTTVEESLELLGYTLIFIGAIEFLRERAMQSSAAREKVTRAWLTVVTFNGILSHKRKSGKRYPTPYRR